LEQAAQALGETIEAVTTMGDFTNYGRQLAKTLLRPAPQKLRTLVVTAKHVGMFDPSIRAPYATQVFSNPCSEITRVQRGRQGPTSQHSR
jgi:hypothetical protein